MEKVSFNLIEHQFRVPKNDDDDVQNVMSVKADVAQ